MDKLTAVFIINPHAGIASKEDIPRQIEKYLDSDKFVASIRFSEYAGHANIIAAEARQAGAAMVVAVGGDGTVNEVARALVHSDTALGIIPCGSGNGLARHLLLPINVRKCIKVLNAFEVHSLDYGTIDEHPFFCTCGVGFDALISQKFASLEHRGPIRYAENILQEAFNYKAQPYELTINGETFSIEALLISCANASQYGNNAYIAPQASMSDGMLDVIIIGPLNLIEASQVSIEMFNKTLNQNDRIKTFRAQELTIRRAAEGVLHFDGDPAIAGKEIVVRIHEKGIRVVVNPLGDKSARQPNALQTATAQLFNNLNLIRRSLLEQLR